MYFESRIMLCAVQYSEYARAVINLLTDVEFKDKHSNKFPNSSECPTNAGRVFTFLDFRKLWC